VKIISDDITNTIVILATQEDYEAITKAIQQLDIAPRQVIIEGMIASVSLTDNLSLGVGGIIKGTLYQNGSPYGANFGLNTDQLNASALAQAGFSFVATDAAEVVRSLITALASDSKAKVLASPHILVSDNRDAKIQVGQQVPLLTSENYSTSSVTNQRTYQYKDIGIILKVKPRINEGGLVSLEISQEISTPEKITLSGSEQLLINKTEVVTNLVVQDGQTIVIGGLIREDTTKTTSGIPFLSRIPFIGWLFGGMSDDKSRTELIILLTPRVIKNQREAKNVSSEFIDKMVDSSKERIKREELTKGKTTGTKESADAPETSRNLEPQKP
jgi:general secretion pathway protein D